MSNRSAHLEVVAGLVEQYVPIYEKGQWDPIIAAETGRGSCFAKNVFGAVILKAVTSGNIITAIQWGDKQHPKEVINEMLGTRKFAPGHSSLLVASKSHNRIKAISFNEKFRKNDAWDIYDFNINEEDPYAIVDGDRISPTQLGAEKGVNVFPWYEAGQRYSAALGITDSVFQVMSETEIESFVMSSLKTDAIPREIPK
jgi:hypothetical protein